MNHSRSALLRAFVALIEPQLFREYSPTSFAVAGLYPSDLPAGANTGRRADGRDGVGYVKVDSTSRTVMHRQPLGQRLPGRIRVVAQGVREVCRVGAVGRPHPPDVVVTRTVGGGPVDLEGDLRSIRGPGGVTVVGRAIRDVDREVRAFLRGRLHRHDLRCLR